MKYYIPLLYCLIIAWGPMSCSSSSDPEPKPEVELTAEEKQMAKLAKTWTLGTVLYGEDDISDRFDGFALTMTKTKGYSATGDLGDFDYGPFKASGTWDFKEGNLEMIHRNDGVDMDVVVGDKTLVLTFTITEANGRVAGLGEYRFDLVTP